MSIIKVEDVAYVRFQAPDLVRMERFLVDFGLSRAEGQSDPSRLYMRGLGPAPFLHVTEHGEPAFLSLGLRAASMGDLDILARATGATIGELEGPGGGKRVSLTDPDGNPVEVVAGQASVQHIRLEKPVPWNSAHDRLRHRAVKRVDREPHQS